MLDRIGWDLLLAVFLAGWFAVGGVLKLLPTRAGRRAVAPAGWVLAVRRLRGAAELLGAVAVAIGIRFPQFGFAGGIVLAALAAWSAVEGVRRPIRVVALVFAVLGFGLAVFFTGFRA